MDKNILREYAKLIAVSGVNVQPRQEVVVRAEPESLDFLETLVEELYLAGAGRVRVEWRCGDAGQRPQMGGREAAP